jgi:septal ring factor EnvC (AmiA/AmiB activator)
MQIVRLLLIFLLLNLSCLAFSQNINNTNQEHDLLKIDTEMNVLQQQLQQKKQTYSNLQQELKQIETHYGHATQSLQETNQQLSLQHRELLELQIKVNDNQKTLNQQQRQLASQIRAAYMLGDQPSLKFLLEPDQHLTTSQLLHYFHYLTAYQVNLILQLKQHIIILQQDENLLKQHYITLQGLEDKQHNEQQQLAALEKNRGQLIIQINQSIKNKNQQLHELAINRQQLEKTIDELNEQHESHLTGSVTQFIGGKNFASLQGRLPWPTPGNVSQQFGTAMDQSELRWDGVLIHAKLNQPVYAVADGQVVFSKWLAGYGLLIIINHGQGYMTLYGRNHSLYKKVGDEIHAGELIATVGQTGGYELPELYFAIRHNT